MKFDFVFCISLVYALVKCEVKWSPNSWMKDFKDVLADRSFYEMTLPGTHDSGTFYMTD